MISPIARRYAKALFKRADSEHLLDPSRKGLEGLQAALSASSELSEVCTNPLFNREEQWDILERVMRQIECPPMVIQFVALLVAKRRLVYFSDISRYFGELVDESKGREVVRVRTSRELSEDDQVEMKTRLEKALGREIVLSIQQAPELIAGAAILVGSQVFDGSVRGRLTELRREMLRRA